MRGGDGAYRWHLGRAIPQRSPEGAILRWYGTTTDIEDERALSAEAQRARFALEDPQASLEMDAVLRAAYQAPAEDLDTISARARRLALTHSAWAAYFAVGIRESGRGRLPEGQTG